MIKQAFLAFPEELASVTVVSFSSAFSVSPDFWVSSFASVAFASSLLQPIKPKLKKLSRRKITKKGLNLDVFM